MGSNINFSNYGNEPPGNGDRGGSENFPLVRQSSIYSLTFDEFQNTLGGAGKDFGSMNMDELLKSIWNAEETQSMATATATAPGAGSSGQDGGNNSGGYLQRQGSLTIPRTLSLRKVDEVWKDIAKDFNGGGGGSNVPQQQQTLGEMTLEEFLMRAGVVKEDTQLGGSGIFGDLAPSRNNGDMGFGINFQQPNRGVDLMGNHMMPTNLPLNVNGARTSQQQSTQIQPLQPQPLQPQQRQQPLYPKQPAVSYGIRGGVVGLGDPGINNVLMPNSAFQGGGGMIVPSGSPATLSSDGLAKSNGDTSSVSPVPYAAYNGGFRGRKPDNTVSKVVERRQRRMIKNRESAARSRARKQAYTMELEQEIAKLKEENEELRKKQAEILEMQKNQAAEMMNEQSEGPRKRLRRTQTGMW
uniref:ABA responsive element binding factor n=1 Tax=Dianthus caryophyllus TaxID=3570 RepID=N0DR69_DIACA|nr:ABA responsive element binding factor [Dianthus caryophyllus]